MIRSKIAHFAFAISQNTEEQSTDANSSNALVSGIKTIDKHTKSAQNTMINGWRLR